MGSGIQKKISKSALERISGCETTLGEMVKAVNHSFGLISNRFQEQDERLLGLFRVLGVKAEDVADAVKANRLDRVTAQVNAAKAALEAGVANGDIVETDVISERSLVVGRELNNDGTEIPPGRAQLLVATLNKDVQDELNGKAVGTVVQVTPEAKLEVMQIFNVVEKEEVVEAEVEGNSRDIDG